MIKIVIQILLLLLSVRGIAQSGTGAVKGTIQNKKQEPVPASTVSLSGTIFTVSTDDNGDFNFKNIPAGNYTLVVTGIGYSATKQNVVVLADKTSTINLQLNENSTELTEIRVLGNQRNRKDAASNIAARMPLAYIENPQVTNTVNRQLITEQALTDFSGVLRNIPGVVKGWSSTNTYYSSRGFNTRSYFRNGIASYSESELDPANLEQMQAIKGPSGTLFGSSLASFGGLFNRITKNPFEGKAVAIDYQAGSYGLNRFAADINTPLNKDKTVLFRVNAASTYQGSYQDAGFLRSLFLAPSLLYKINDRLTIFAEAEFYNREATSQQQIAVTGSIENLRKYTDYKRAYSNNSITLRNPYLAFYGQANYKLSSHWTSQTNITRSQGSNTGNYLTFTLLRDSLLIRNITQYPTSKSGVTQVQQNFIGDFLIGRLRNRLVAGLDFYQLSSNFGSNALGGRGGRPSFDTLNVRRAMPNYGLINPTTINARLNNFPATFITSEQDIYSAYLSNVLNVTARFSVMASLRLDRFNAKGTFSPATGITTGKYSQTSLAPKFGVVYQLVKDRISVFGNYMSGFQNTPGTDVNNIAFKPQYANQLEGGLKTDLYGEKLSATISYYDIRVTNTLRADVANAGFSIQDGTQYSRGFEVEILSKPVSGLAITAGIAHNTSILTQADASVSGLRPVNAGPANSGTVWASYHLPFKKISGFGLGFGGTYTGNNLLSNTKAAGSFYTDAYTLLNAGIFLNQPHYRVSLNADNLSNKYYYTTGFGIATPGMLRRVILGLSVKF
jgi:iron complex outermembrane receptor protein